MQDRCGAGIAVDLAMLVGKHGRAVLGVSHLHPVAASQEHSRHSHGADSHSVQQALQVMFPEIVPVGSHPQSRAVVHPPQLAIPRMLVTLGQRAAVVAAAAAMTVASHDAVRQLHPSHHRAVPRGTLDSAGLSQLGRALPRHRQSHPQDYHLRNP